MGKALGKPKPVITCASNVTGSTHSKATRQGIHKARKQGIVWGRYGKELAKTNHAHACDFALNVKPSLLALGPSGTYYKPDGTPRYTALARKLNEIQLPTPKDGNWYGTSVRRVITRLGPEFIHEVLQARKSAKQSAEALSYQQALKELMK